MLLTLLAVAGKVAAKAKAPPKEGFVKYLDAANEFVSHPNFETAIRNPYFWGVSIVFLGAALFRGWKMFLIGYVVIFAMWGVVHYTVLKDRAAAAESTSSVMIFAAMTVGVAGLAIYFMLIRD